MERGRGGEGEGWRGGEGERGRGGEGERGRGRVGSSYLYPTQDSTWIMSFTSTCNCYIICEVLFLITLSHVMLFVTTYLYIHCTIQAGQALNKLYIDDNASVCACVMAMVTVAVERQQRKVLDL